jgi:hypothetical protein
VNGTRAWIRDVAAAAAWCAALAIATHAAGARAAEAAATNLDVLNRLTTEVVNELQGKFMPGVGGRPVRLKPFAAGDDYVFVTNVFMTELTRAGVTTLAPATIQPVPGGAPGNPGAGAAGMDAAVTDPAAPEGALVLQYQNVAFSMKYVDSHRSYVFGGKRVERQASVRVMATLSDASGAVLWVGEAQRESLDEFDYGDAARIEEGNYQFARPVMPSGGWGRYAEPVFVTGVIVGLIYLFFSNQSDN